MSKSMAKGSMWERAICNELKENGWPHVDRIVKHGVNDIGDIRLYSGCPVVIEAKNEARTSFSTYLKEVEVEVANANAEFGVAWVKRRGKATPGDAYVVMDGKTFMHLLAKAGFVQ